MSFFFFGIKVYFLFSGWLSLFFLDTIVVLSTERNSSVELVLMFDLSVHIPLFSISSINIIFLVKSLAKMYLYILSYSDNFQ